MSLILPCSDNAITIINPENAITFSYKRNPLIETFMGRICPNLAVSGANLTVSKLTVFWTEATMSPSYANTVGSLHIHPAFPCPLIETFRGRLWLKSCVCPEK